VRGVNKTILVTGGAGYIGSHTCKELQKAGYLPVTVDNLVHGHKWAVKWGPLVTADIRDAAALRAVFEEYRPSAVFHFASFCYVGESVGDPGKYYGNNICGALSLLDAMLEHRCRDIVFSGSCATFGPPKTLPIPETHPQNPVSPYGASKLFIEHILRDYERAHGLRHAILRYFNAAGADPDGDTGEAHDPETHLIPLAMAAAGGNGAPLMVFGDDYPTPDGTCIRDYVHVTDLAGAHIMALEHIRDFGSRDFNLGTGRGCSVKEVIRTVEDVTGRKVPYSIGPQRPGDPSELVADARRAGSEMGWTPAFPDLETMVRHAWQWYRELERLG